MISIMKWCLLLIISIITTPNMLQVNARTLYIGGHGDKIKDETKQIKTTPAPTPQPSRAYKKPTPLPTPHTTHIPLHHKNSSLYVENPIIHTSESTEYVGGIVEYANGTTQTPAPVTSTPSSTPSSTPKPASVPAPAPIGVIIPKAPHQINQSSLEETQHNGGWGGTYVHNNTVNEPTLINGWPVDNATGTLNSSVSTSNNNVAPINNGNINTTILQATTAPTVATVSTYQGTVDIISPSAVIPTDNKLSEPTSITFGGAIVQHATGQTNNSTTNNSTTTSEASNITTSLHTQYNNIEYGGVVTSPRVNIPGHCAIYGHPSFLSTFDGKVVMVTGLGEFIMYSNAAATEQVNIIQHRSSVSSWVNSVAFRTNDAVLTVSLENVATANKVVVAVRLNGRPISLSSKPKDIAGYSILQEGKLKGSPRLSLTMKNSNGTKVAAIFYNRANYYHMDVFVQVDGKQFSHTKGLCGHYDFLSNNDLLTPDNQIATQDEQFVASWAVQHPKSQFHHFLPKMDPLVVDTNTTTFQLERDYVAYSKAKYDCKRVALNMPKLKKACILNRLMGHKTGMEEISDIVNIMSEGAISLDTSGKKCVKHEFLLGSWGKWSNCSSACGKGQRARQREMIVNNNVCGYLKQTIHCQNHCGRPELWSKCALWGAGHVSTFDQVEYDFQAPGEYTAYYDPNSKEEVRILRYRPKNTSSATFISGVSFRFGADLFTAQTIVKINKSSITHFTYNNHIVDIGMIETPLGFLKVKRTSRSATSSQMLLEIKSAENTIVTITYGTVGNVPFMNLFIEIHGAKLGQTHGICGVWNLNPLDDFVTSSGKIESSGTAMAITYRKTPEQSVFFYAVPVSESPPLYNPTVADLQPTSLLSLAAKQSCNTTSKRYRSSCLFDVVYLKTSHGAQATLDVQTIMADNRIRADGETSVCLQQPGTKLGVKTNWTTKCSRICGGGKYLRTQPVINSIGRSCGQITISKPCNEQPCPHDCQVTPWSAWSYCGTQPAGCGNGTRRRIRQILHHPKFGGKKCPQIQQIVPCRNTSLCCKVGKWGEWGICKLGVQIQYRDVNFGHCGWDNRTRPCCEISHWSDWTPCVNGNAYRQRLTRGDPHLCARVTKNETKACCNIGQYGDWSKCYNGIQYRQRHLEGNNKICQHYTRVENRTCCQVGQWSAYGICKNGTRHSYRETIGHCKFTSKVKTKSCCNIGDWQPHTPCTNGYQYKRRIITGDQETCKPYKRLQKQKCCVVHNWGPWTNCTNGLKTRTRITSGHIDVCKVYPNIETKACCHVEDWTAWSTCKPGKTMNAQATQSRSRIVHGDKEVCSAQNNTEIRSCCAVLSDFSHSNWTPCHNGFRQRYRHVAGTELDCKLFPSVENRTCCDIGLWSQWGECKNGKVQRHRTLTGEQCHIFNSTEIKPCCHVHDWSDWSSCNNGYLTRTRKLEGDKDFCKKWRSIDSKPCCQVGAWSDYSPCKSGSQYRTRNVTNNPTFCGGIKTIKKRKCCEVSVWSGWTMCHNGVQQRTRTTKGDPQACLYVTPIQRQKCCKISQWGRWSTCINMTQTRTREVTGHEGCTDDFSTKQARTCGILACKAGNWSTWSTCENGTQHRHRTVWGADICTHKFPPNDTRNCTGPIQPCVIGEWSVWTNCSDGQVRRFRTLSGNCSIDHSKLEHKPCRCIPGNWGEWSYCINGHKHRHRKNLGTCNESLPTNETIACEQCVVGPWSLWSTCENNHRNRTRNVSGECIVEHSKIELQSCEMPITQQPTSAPTPSPTDGSPPPGVKPLDTCNLGKWSHWSDCDPKTHKKHRIRSVGGICLYNWTTTQAKHCHCFTTSWSSWSHCHNDGKEYRFRNLTLRSHGCADNNEVRLNDSRNCCEAMEWSHWSNCSIYGNQTRTRIVKGGEHCNIRYKSLAKRQCCNIGIWGPTRQEKGYLVRERNVTESIYCNKHYKRIEKQSHCLVGHWDTTWSTCNANGTKYKHRYVDPYPHCLKKHPQNKSELCCEKTAWSTWSDCIKDDSKFGHTIRERKVFGNSYCKEKFPEKENKSCADCELGPWSEFSNCKPQGWIERNRTVEGGPWCVANRKSKDIKPCCHVGEWHYLNGIDKCGKSGHYKHTRNVTNTTYCLGLFPNYKLTPCCFAGPWTPWSICNLKTGYHSRTREIGPAIECNQKFQTIQNQTCCVVGKWSKWDSKCDNGTTTRTRTIKGHYTCNVRHKSKQTAKCCKIGTWGSWSTCNKGIQKRTRYVPIHDHCQSKYKSYQKRHCCSVGNWTEWSKCMDSSSERTRIIHGGKICQHKFTSKQHRPCTMPCSPGNWSEWSTCSDGVKRRRRIIKGSKISCPKLSTIETQQCCQCQNQGPKCPCYTKPIPKQQQTCECIEQGSSCPCFVQPEIVEHNNSQQHQVTTTTTTTTNNNNNNNNNNIKHNNEVSSTNQQQSKQEKVKHQVTHKIQKPMVIDKPRFAERKPKFGQRNTINNLMVPVDLAEELEDNGMIQNYEEDEDADSLLQLSDFL